MRLIDAIFKYMEPIQLELLETTDKKREKELEKQLKPLRKEFKKVSQKDDYDWENSGLHYDEEDDDVEDRKKINPKKIISDEEYAQLIDKWSKIVGKQLYTPEQQNYIDNKEVLMESIKDIMTPEEIKEELRKFDYEWTHRKEEAEDRIRREQEHIQYVNMINNMTPEELKRFRSLRDEDPERDKLYKSVSEVKTKDEE
ncbi:MAG: hypothetical protein MR288_00710 [Firmicutes bacterium]|nr:hypothetical protein [Bacillota bacterium]